VSTDVDGVGSVGFGVYCRGLNILNPFACANVGSVIFPVSMHAWQ
jgi:hypothetical protein